MPYEDLREYLSALKEKGELKVCRKEVDRKIEIAKVTDKSSKLGGPAILFEKVKGFDAPVVTGLFGTVERVYMAIDATKHDGFKRMQNGWQNPIPCRLVQDGPCKQVVRTGNAVNLLEIPALWHHEKDSHYYLSTTNCISKDPDSGKGNNSIHRVAVIDRNRLAVWINLPMHLRLIARKYLQRGQPCPIAIVIGTDPVVLLSASCKVPYGMDELEFAGGIRGKAVETVKCETIDLHVPATAELVIEGEIIPGDEDGYVGKSEYADEGPFPEVTGYFGLPSRSPVVHVRAITHRKNFIYHGLGAGVPPSEIQMIVHLGMQNDIYARAKTVVPSENIRAINPSVGACCFTVIISIRKTHPGQGKQLIYALLAQGNLKRVIVVDEDIDAFNPMEVDWAVSMRSRAEDYILTSNTTGMSLDPTITHPNLIAKVGIDATMPREGDKIGSMKTLRDLGPTKYAAMEELNLEDYVK